MRRATAAPVAGDAWPALLAAADMLKGRSAGQGPAKRAAAAGGLRWQPGAGWRRADGLDAATRDFIDLYLPVCQPLGNGTSRVIAHLGQSLDGCIATRSGDSCFVTGRENIRHLHRMRALADAVIVGAGTVASDDPRLTTRLVEGPSPVRVVIDPHRRLGPELRVFNDGAAPTLVCCAQGLEGPPQGQAEVIGVPAPAGRLDLSALVETLRRRGLRRLFVEGGGVTVSDFLARGLLDRLQIAVAPLIIGAGRPGVTLPPRPVLADALRPPARLYRMGGDVLYDFDLTGALTQEAAPDGDACAALARVC